MTPTWKVYGDSLPNDRWCEKRGVRRETFIRELIAKRVAAVRP